MTAFVAVGGGLLTEGLGGWLFCVQLLLTFGLLCSPFAVFGMPAFLLLLRFHRLSWYCSACVGALVAAIPVAAFVILLSFDPESAEAEVWDADALASITVANHGTPTTAGWQFLWTRLGAAGVVGAFGGIAFWLTFSLLIRRPEVNPGERRNEA